jgi:sugar/nucleoside kinase (ribokinase family)
VAAVARAAVVGNLARDVVNRGAPTPGGCPRFAVDAFRRLARGGQILTRFAGGDGELFGALLDTSSADVTVLPAQTTSGFSLDYAGEEREMGVTAIGEVWRPEDAQALAPEVDWVHVAPLLRSDFPPETLAALGDGRRLSLDGQGLVRLPAVGRLELDDAFDRALLASVTTLKLSEEEARIVARGAFDGRAAARLGVPEVLLTLGSHGAIIFRDGSETFVPAAWPVLGVQTTGAGDAFMVGYVAARAEGAEPVDAARAASRLVAELLEERKRAGVQT